jgi:hypothetical protein
MRPPSGAGGGLSAPGHGPGAAGAAGDGDLQAYDQVGDADAVVTAQMDQRWQLVLDCLGATEAPFSQGVLVKFRERMIAHDLDRKLLTRTIELAKRTGKFGWQHLQAALDSSPLLGAGRIEDTWNLIGRALGAVVTCAAKAVGRPRAQVLAEARLTLVDHSSLKAALDIDWDDPAAQAAALERLLSEVDRMEQWVAAQSSATQATPALQLHTSPAWTGRLGSRCWTGSISLDWSCDALDPRIARSVCAEGAVGDQATLGPRLQRGEGMATLPQRGA